MKTVFHKSGGVPVRRPLIQEGINGKLPFFAGIHMGAGCASRFASFAAAQRRTAFFYRPR